MILPSGAIEDYPFADSIFQGVESGVNAKDASVIAIECLALGLTIYASIVDEDLATSTRSNSTNAESTC